MEDRTQTAKRSFGSLFNVVFSFVVGLYIAALASYLLLRALFGDRFWWLSLVNTFAYLIFLPLLALLPAALVLRMRRNVLRLMPVALIGGLWFAPYFAPKTASVPSGQTLRALTFNVWGYNPRMNDVEAWIRDSGADVVMLQEITPQHTQEVLPKLYELYPYHSDQEDLHHWNGTPNYNTTLSRYPILEIEEVDLQTPDTSNPVRIVLDVNGQKVAVYNVHMAWPGGKPRFPIPARLNHFYVQVMLGYTDKIRNAQINRLLEHLKTEPYPYIFAGDFNTSDQTPTYNLLASHLRDAFREAGTGLGGSWPVASSRGLPGFLPPLIRIDYIWHSDHFRTVEAQQGPPLGSDHLALLATLALSPTS
ncbi:MAG: endonuclease/exonuclease/phosphatase family protein [Anaerolineae bacterium]|nr:endonuclease/exonuclease/phosphatase family protein [Anaerolineae bacterium]